MTQQLPDSLRDRDIRQRALVPPERLAACQAVVIGIGAIGRQVALLLAATGVPRLALYDDDHVAVENLAPQGYWPSDLGKPKVEATAALCRQVHPPIEIVAVAERFRRATAETLPRTSGLAVFLCVDAIATRRMLWRALRNHASFLADGRMSADVVRTLAADAPGVDATYETTLFEPAEAYAGACTARSTLYSASIAAGLLVAQFSKWLRRLPVDADLLLNLLTAELTVLTPRSA